MKYSLSNDTWNSDELNAIEEVIKSNRYTLGAKVKQFEMDFANYFGSKYAIMSNSGSSANLLIFASLIYSGRLKKGDEVLVTSISWSTTYYPIEQMGLKMKLVDVDINTINVDYNKLEKAISKKTKAVFAVNLLGNPNDFEKLENICSENNLLLLEDNCEAMGATFKNKKCGTFGLLGSFSTFYSHHLCTMEGGVTVTDDEELYHYMLAIRAHGWTRQLPENNKLAKVGKDPFYDSFQFVVPGFNLRPVEMEAAIGIEQLKKLNKFIEIRRKNAENFKKLFSNDNRFITQQEIGESSWFGFSFIISPMCNIKRAIFIEALREADIEVRPIVAGNFAKQKVFQFMNGKIAGDLNNSDYIHDNGFFVGNHSVLMDEELLYLKKILDSIS